MERIHNKHNVTNICYHIIWITKYRKHILKDDIKNDLYSPHFLLFAMQIIKSFFAMQKSSVAALYDLFMYIGEMILIFISKYYE